MGADSETCASFCRVSLSNHDQKFPWNHPRRVVAKAEHIDGKENPRYVVTSLSAEAWPAQKLYEELYCGRGDMENRIKEQFTLFADRVSAETMRANQLRLYFSAIAYLLVCGLRRLGLKATELATAQAATIRLRLLKIGALVRVTVRRICISLPRSYPWRRSVCRRAPNTDRIKTFFDL